MTTIIVNHRPLGGVDETIGALRLWLVIGSFHGGFEKNLQSKWDSLGTDARLVLAALSMKAGMTYQVTPSKWPKSAVRSRGQRAGSRVHLCDSDLDEP
jgi:hypothetical protein